MQALRPGWYVYIYLLTQVVLRANHKKTAPNGAAFHFIFRHYIFLTRADNLDVLREAAKGFITPFCAALLKADSAATKLAFASSLFPPKIAFSTFFTKVRT